MRLFQSMRFALECFGVALLLAGIWRWAGLPREIWAVWLVAVLSMLGTFALTWLGDRVARRELMELIEAVCADAEAVPENVGSCTGACEDGRVMCEYDGYVLERSVEDENTVYITMPDGLRLVFREDEYVGWYVCGERTD
jgi:hypothetical protein